MQRIWMHCEILRFEFIDEDDGVLVVFYEWLRDRDEVKEMVIDFMSKYNYTHNEHYTINNAGHLVDTTWQESVAAIRFKNPEDFIMMKLSLNE